MEIKGEEKTDVGEDKKEAAETKKAKPHYFYLSLDK